MDLRQFVICLLLLLSFVHSASSEEKELRINDVVGQEELNSTKQTIIIYLAGSIQKGNSSSKELFWTKSDIDILRSDLRKFEVVFLNPACGNDELSNPSSVFGRDMLYVFSSNIVFVDARDRRGLGVGAEMMWAKMNKIPVVAWVPKNSHYHKSQAGILGTTVNDFIHPFILALSDQIVESLDQGAAWIEQVISNPSSVNIKGIEQIHTAMEHYKAHP